MCVDYINVYHCIRMYELRLYCKDFIITFLLIKIFHYKVMMGFTNDGFYLKPARSAIGR